MTTQFCLTIKDLSHGELVKLLEKSGVMKVLTERCIAEIVLQRNANNCIRLKPIIEADLKKLKRIRSRAEKNEAIRKYNRKVATFNNAAKMVSRILEQFPEFKEETEQ